MNTDGHLTAREAQILVQLPPSGGLTPAERLAVSDHLAECAACRSLVAAGRIPSGDGPRILKAEMQRLADSAQKDREDDAADTQAFARRLETFPPERFEPGSTLPPPSSKGRETVGTAVPWWTALFSPGTYAFAGSALAAVIIILGVTTFFHRSDTAAQSKVAGARPPLLKDGPVLVTADGLTQVSTDFPADLRAAILEAIQQRAVRLPGGLLGAMRGDTGQSAASATPPPAVPPFPVVPAPGSTIETSRPHLRWTGVPGATEYRVEIRSLSTGDKIVSPALPASQSDWQPESPLEQGRLYRWSVTATVAPSHEAIPPVSASLKILRAAGAEELRQLRAAPKISHLALAVACARLDLAAEARQELDALFAEDPESALAAQLRASFDTGSPVTPR